VSTTLIGQTLGKTEIKELLGLGGMAAVYKGFQPDVDRYVAVKVLAQIPELNQPLIDRFKLEARTIARLQHPHILPLYDFGEARGLLYLVMAYVSGGSLSDMIAKGPVALSTAARILREVASALDYAHREGVIHRDIKPANILINSDGYVLLADFGIVKLLTEGKTTANLTGGSGVVGTPAYMSPEQANGQPLDGRSDIYALGVVAYEMITGRQPFSAETPIQLLLKHLSEPPPHLQVVDPGMPMALDIVLQRALAKDPQSRYDTATGFAEAFTQAISNTESITSSIPRDQPTLAPVPTIPPASASGSATSTSPKPLTSQSLITVLLAGAAILALALAVVALLTSNQQIQPSAAPTAIARSTSAPSAVPRTQVPSVPSFGAASFTTTENVGDTVNLVVENLAPAPPGTTYTAWLISSEDDSPLRLGTLELDSLGRGFLRYTQPGRIPLPAIYGRLIVTQETEQGETPEGRTAYEAQAPASVTQALSEILSSSQDGINEGSLLTGALAEANFALLHTGYAAAATTVPGLKSHAEHAINILLGTQEDLDDNGRPENPGRGVGVAFFLDEISQRLDMAALDPLADTTIQAQIELMRVCAGNARARMNEIINLERELLQAADLESVQSQTLRSTEEATALIEGQDLNGNGTIEFFEGECGLRQIAESGIVMGNLTLRAAEAGS
jgi:serine/threonine-protein kinase